jgi:hypothetical protein
VTTREQRAVAVIRAGRLTVLQRKALAALLVAVGGDEPSRELLSLVYVSALDALAPRHGDDEA